MNWIAGAGAPPPSSEPRRYLARFVGSALRLEANGFHSRVYSTELGDVGFLSDYTLPELEGLAQRILSEGLPGLAGLPDNTIAFVARRSVEPVEIFAVRDAVGNTPLFVGGRASSPTFASDLESLRLNTPELSLAVDPEAVGEYLLFRYTSGPRTLIEGVSQPLAGHLLRFSGGRSTHLEWRDLRGGFGVGNFRKASASMEAALGTSLQREAPFTPLGIMFSGGLDSCYIAYALRRPDLTLYTLAFPGVGEADLRAAAVEATALGLELAPIRTDSKTFADRLPGAISRFGWPIDHPNFVGRDILFERAAGDGINRVLSGDGSDTIFGGAWYVSLSKALLAKRFTPAILQHLPSIGRRVKQLKRILATSVEDLVLFDKTYYERDRAAALAVARPASLEHLREHRRKVADWDPLDQAFYLAHLTTLSVYPSAQRGMAWSRGVDVGYPFLDERVVRLANGVSGREKVKGFRAKRLFLEASAAVLPQRVITRPKYGLPVPFSDFILGDGGMLRYQDLLRAGDSVTGELLESREVRAILDRLTNGRHGPDDFELYWVLLNIEIWARQAVRGEVVA